MSVVAFADHRIGDCVQQPRPFAPGSFVEIARILFQQRWQYRASDQSTGRHVAVSRGVPLGVALCALPISAEIILRLLQSGNGSSQAEGHRISHALPGQLELLPRNKRSRVWNIAHIEIRNETERALL